MTGPTPLREQVEELAVRLLRETTSPDREAALAQVLATLVLADAVRSTVVHLEPVDSYTESFDRPYPAPVVAMTGTPAQFGIDDETSAQLCSYEVGDTDPTSSDGPYCTSRKGGYGCTWPSQHYGRHVAGDGAEVCAVWA